MILFSAGISPLSCNYCFSDALYRWVLCWLCSRSSLLGCSCLPSSIPYIKEASDWTHKPFLHKDFGFFSITSPPTLNFLSQNSLKFISLPSVFSPGSRLLGNHSLFNLFKLLTSASLCPHHYFPEFIQLSHWFIRQTHNRNIIQMWWAFSLSCSELYHNVLEHKRSTEFLDQRADACWWFTGILCFPGGWREHSEQHGWVDPSWSRLWESLY